MNAYLKNLSKIEFVLTDACTGRCKHCSEGDHPSVGKVIDAELAREAVRRVSAEYPVRTVMVFGGEPLLYPNTVYKIISAARDIGVERRQVITNGFFTKDSERMREVAEGLFASGVNDLLISVDAFHQETIPLGVVQEFAAYAVSLGIPTRLSPAWLVSPDAENSYNRRTREILDSFGALALTVGVGNIVFPEGNARKYLSEYFKEAAPENPYTEDPCNLKCLSFSPNGEVLDGNFYERDIMEIIENYRP